MTTEKKLTLDRMTAMITMFSCADGEPGRMKGLPVALRFYSKVQIDTVSGCWNWKAYTDRDGYSRFTSDARTVSGHGFIYEYFNGVIPASNEIHHYCRNRPCVNPEHLTAVTHAENMRLSRQRRCSRGHLKSGGNLYINPQTGAWVCRICQRAAARGRSIAC